MQDMENLLKTMPGAVVSRYLSRETLQDVGARRQPFCPIDLEGGHEFHVLTRTVAGPDITSDMLSILKNGKQCSSYIMENVCLICLLGFG